KSPTKTSTALVVEAPPLAQSAASLCYVVDEDSSIRQFLSLVLPGPGIGAAVLEHVKNIGVEHKLNMLPVLKKPYETEAIVKIILELKLGMPTANACIELEPALDNK